MPMKMRAEFARVLGPKLRRHWLKAYNITLTARELSDRWGLTVGTLANWRCMGVGPRWKRLPGPNPRRPVAYALLEIERYEKKHGKPATRKKRRL